LVSTGISATIDLNMELISTPGKFPKQGLKADKSRAVWLYFRAGTVGEIKVAKTRIDVLVVYRQLSLTSFDLFKLLKCNCKQI